MENLNEQYHALDKAMSSKIMAEFQGQIIPSRCPDCKGKGCDDCKDGIVNYEY